MREPGGEGMHDRPGAERRDAEHGHPSQTAPHEPEPVCGHAREIVKPQGGEQNHRQLKRGRPIAVELNPRYLGRTPSTWPSTGTP